MRGWRKSYHPPIRTSVECETALAWESVRGGYRLASGASMALDREAWNKGATNVIREPLVPTVLMDSAGGATVVRWYATTARLSPCVPLRFAGGVPPYHGATVPSRSRYRPRDNSGSLPTTEPSQLGVMPPFVQSQPASVPTGATRLATTAPHALTPSTCASIVSGSVNTIVPPRPCPRRTPSPSMLRRRGP